MLKSDRTQTDYYIWSRIFESMFILFILKTWISINHSNLSQALKTSLLTTNCNEEQRYFRSDKISWGFDIFHIKTTCIMFIFTETNQVMPFRRLSETFEWFPSSDSRKRKMKLLSYNFQHFSLFISITKCCKQSELEH